MGQVYQVASEDHGLWWSPQQVQCPCVPCGTMGKSQQVLMRVQVQAPGRAVSVQLPREAAQPHPLPSLSCKCLHPACRSQLGLGLQPGPLGPADAVCLPGPNCSEKKKKIKAICPELSLFPGQDSWQGQKRWVLLILKNPERLLTSSLTSPLSQYYAEGKTLDFFF